MKEKVYVFLKTIPKGKVAIYGQIAAYLRSMSLQRNNRTPGIDFVIFTHLIPGFYIVQFYWTNTLLQ